MVRIGFGRGRIVDLGFGHECRGRAVGTQPKSFFFSLFGFDIRQTENLEWLSSLVWWGRATVLKGMSGGYVRGRLVKAIILLSRGVLGAMACLRQPTIKSD